MRREPVPVPKVVQVGRQCSCGYIQYVPALEPFPSVCPNCEQRYAAIEKDALENLREVLLSCQNYNFVMRVDPPEVVVEPMRAAAQGAGD